MLHTSFVVGKFLGDIWVVRGKLSQPGQAVNGLLAMSIKETPSGAFFERDKSDDHQGSWDELESNGDEPLAIALGGDLIPR